MPARQGVGANQHNGAGGGNVKRAAHSHRMTDKNVALKPLHLVGRDNAILERAKACGNTVGNSSALKQGLHCIGGACDQFCGSRANFNARRVGLSVSNRIDLIKGQVCAVQINDVCFHQSSLRLFQKNAENYNTNYKSA